MPVIYACFINARFKNEISMMASCFTESKVKMIYMFLNDNMLLVLLMITSVCVNHIATLDISCCYSYIFYNIHCQCHRFDSTSISIKFTFKVYYKFCL